MTSRETFLKKDTLNLSDLKSSTTFNLNKDYEYQNQDKDNLQGCVFFFLLQNVLHILGDSIKGRTGHHTQN